MNKLLVPVVLLLAAIGAVLLLAQRRNDSARSGTFRPRSKAFRSGPNPADPHLQHLMSRREAVGLRDAYSSAAIDPQQPLRCCCGCQALYHLSSLVILKAQNEGRCTACGGTAFASVRWVD
jgi:hypothetical protein